MSQLKLSWNDAHFSGLRSQTNIYSLSKLSLERNRSKLLASSIDGHLASVQFSHQPSFSEKLKPITKNDVLFNSVLNSNNSDTGDEIEVVSMDVVQNWNHQRENVLAVTYLKLAHFDTDKPPQAFMNIYRLTETENGSLDDSKSLLQSMGLEFIPFKLTHQNHRLLFEERGEESVLLLSGNDHKIHSYQPVTDYSGYEEVETAKFFPEMSDIHDNVTQLEVRQLDELHRLTSMGTQNGLVSLSLVNSNSNEILQSWTTEMDSPITSLHFFSQYTNTQCPDFVDEKVPVPYEESTPNVAEESERKSIHLIATSALDPSVVYCNVLANGLSKFRILPVSNSQDVVLCSCVMDVDFDGENEVLIGTYGQVLMAYKLLYEKPAVLTSTPFHTPMPVPINNDTPIQPNDDSKDKSGKITTGDSQEKDVRRRHKTVAATVSDNEAVSMGRFKMEDSINVSEGNLQHSQMSRFFRSQENLTSPSTKSIHFETPERMMTPDLTVPQFATSSMTEYPCYKLIWTRRFCNPLMGLMCEDVMGDGMLDLVVLTLKGLHILQPDLHEVASVILSRLQTLCHMNMESQTQDPTDAPKCDTS